MSVRDLLAAIAATFGHWATHAEPTALPDPPDFRTASYREFVRDHGVRWTTLDEVVREVQGFLDPVLAGVQSTLDATAWTWRDDQSGLEP